MRKILVALVMTLGMLTPVAISAPANAVECSTKVRTADFRKAHSSNPIVIKAHVVLNYDDCGQFAEFNFVKYQVWALNELNDKPACKRIGNLRKVRLNVGAYQTWNPPARDFDCPINTNSSRMTKFVFSNDVIWKGQADICAKFYFKVDYNNWSDHNEASKNKCLW